jgi:hypothetical protein
MRFAGKVRSARCAAPARGTVATHGPIVPHTGFRPARFPCEARGHDWGCVFAGGRGLETVGFRHSCDHDIFVVFRDCSPGIFLSVLSAFHDFDCHDFDSLSFIEQHPCCPRRTRHLLRSRMAQSPSGNRRKRQKVRRSVMSAMPEWTDSTGSPGPAWPFQLVAEC